MGIVRVCISVAAAAFSVLGAMASEDNLQPFVDGVQLFEWCAPDVGDEQSIAACGGYIMGVYDENSAAGRFGDDEFRFCPPDEIALDDFIQIIRQHLETHPQTRKEPANKLVLAALYNAYPCSD